MTASQARPSTRSLLGLLLLVLAISGAAMGWREHLAQGLGREISRAAQPGDIRMLSSLTCVFCARARQWLTARQIPFEECLIERDAACAERYDALGAPGTPVLLVRGQAQLGFSPLQLRDRLAAASASSPSSVSPAAGP